MTSSNSSTLPSSTEQKAGKFRVAIVGGGLGGLLLAHLLKDVPDVALQVFERDENPSSRNQGLVIGLNQDGYDAICKAPAMRTRMEKLLRADSAKDLVMLDSKGSLLFQVKEVLIVKLANVPANASTVRSGLVDRSVLRTALAEDVPLKFNKKFTNYVESESSVTVHFEDGSSAEVDLLIGADGARSAIRRQRCHALEPDYLDCWSIGGTVEVDSQVIQGVIAQKAKQGLVRLLGRGGMSWLSFVYCADGQPDKLLWSLSMPMSIANAKGLPKADLVEARKLTAAIGVEFGCDEVGYLVSKTKVAAVFFPGYQLTSVKAEVLDANCLTNFRGFGRVTLLGDAAHKTTTHAGLGANTAFQDAVDLANAIREIAEKKATLNDRLIAYEKVVCKRGAWVVRMSAGNTARIHAPDSVAKSVMMWVMWSMGFVTAAINWFR